MVRINASDFFLARKTERERVVTNFYQALSQFFLIFEQTSTLESVNKTFAGVMRIIFQLSFRPNHSSTFVVGREGRVWGRDFRESINY